MAGFRSKVTKPSTLPEWFGTIIDPGGAKKTAGWLDEEVVPHQWLNWFFNLVYLVVRYLRVAGEDASDEDFIVSETSPTSSVLIGVGRVRQFDMNLDVAAQTFPWPTLAPTPAGDRRIDVLTLNSFGLPIVLAGVEVTAPTLPIAPVYAGAFPVAEILLNGSAGGTPNIIQRNIVSITRSGAVATATTAVAHGLTTNDAIYIFGADQPEYNVLANVTGVTAFTFTYTVGGTPASPATGTMIASTIKDVRGFLSNTTGEPTVDLAIVNRYDLSKSLGPLVNVVWPWSAPTKLTNPATLPTDDGQGSAWSPNGEFLAVAHNTSPFITIYQRDGTTFIKLANPATLPTGSGQDLAWSPNGEFLAVAHLTSPRITIYQRDGRTFTKLANPAILPANNGSHTAWSPNGEFLAVAHPTSPFVTIYQRDGTTFTKLADPATLPTGTGFGAVWSPNGEFLAVAHIASPFITIYQRNGTTFTKLADPATLPAGDGFGAAWSPNGKFLAVAHATTPFITIYQRDGTIFTKLANPATLPSLAGTSAAWSPNGEFLAVTHGASPFITIYQRDGTIFTKLANPATLPASSGTGSAWSPNGEFLAVAHITSPFITIYQTTGQFPAEYVNLRILAPVLD